MKMRQINACKKGGIKRETGPHYDFIQVTNEHFKAESQAVGFLEVPQMF